MVNGKWVSTSDNLLLSNTIALPLNSTNTIPDCSFCFLAPTTLSGSLTTCKSKSSALFIPKRKLTWNFTFLPLASLGIVLKCPLDLLFIVNKKSSSLELSINLSITALWLALTLATSVGIS